MKSLTLAFAIPFTVLGLVLNGCTSEPTSTEGPETSPPPATVDPHQGHVHPSEGPHHGDLIELGNEEYHAEIVHDDAAGTIMIFVLDGSATRQVPIDATEVRINASHDGNPKQFTLTASPDTTDTDGKSSRFVSTDEELAALLDEEGAEVRLVLTINGRSYRGDIVHDHDHVHD